MLIGQKLGSYSLEKELGSGAMGTVYRARNDKTGARVAIKILAFGLGRNDKARERFEREIDVLQQLKHPNVVRYINHGRFQGTEYVAMEFIDGETLDAVMHRGDRFSWEKVVEIGQQICAALHHAHLQGIVHRDLKPSNLMMDRDGVVKLTDFGIAKDLDETALTSAHCTVGTAAYMSPEQCRGEKQLSHRSDLYSLGVVLYELLTGQKPYQAETAMEMFMKHAHGTFERPARIVLDIPVWLDSLVCQLLAKEPEERGFDAAAVAEQLGRIVEKVEAQASAGVAAARTRVMNPLQDRTRIEDIQDRKAAQTLRTSLGGKKKRRSKPIHQQVWMRAAAMAAGLLLVVGILGWVLWPKSANVLYEESKFLWETNIPDQQARARAGPIEDYLRRFGDRDDDQARKIHEWADLADRHELDQAWDKRRGGPFPPQEKAEGLYRDALKAEQAGDLVTAVRLWSAMEQVDGETPREKRIRRAFAAEKKKAPERALALEPELKTLNPRDKPQGERAMALFAVRYERFGDSAYARQNWLQLRMVAGRSPWGLLATKKAAEQKIVTVPEARKERLNLLQSAIRDIEGNLKTSPVTAQQAAQDVRDLYAKDADPEVRGLAKKAMSLAGLTSSS